MSEEQQDQAKSREDDGPRADEDWKQSVAQERDSAHREAPQGADAEPAVDAKGDVSAGQDEHVEQEADSSDAPQLPEPDFRTFLAGLYTQTLMALGEVENPMTKEREPALPEASFLIDTIAMLRGKTQGNLSSDEQSYLDALLHDLRLRYVAAKQSST